MCIYTVAISYVCGCFGNIFWPPIMVTGWLGVAEVWKAKRPGTYFNCSLFGHEVVQLSEKLALLFFYRKTRRGTLESRAEF